MKWQNCVFAVAEKNLARSEGPQRAVMGHEIFSPIVRPNTGARVARRRSAFSKM
jgi:hypothetical protein